MSSRLKLILKEKERFQPTGTTYLLLASLIVFFLFDRYIAATALLYLSTGDSIAATIGQRYGRHKLFRKSLEGSLACLISCLIIGLAMSIAYSEISFVVVMAGAFSATFIESLPVPIDDNLTVPLAGAGAMWLVSLV